MLNILPTNSPIRLATPIPGVPEAQARALDRRRRLNRQLLSFKAIDRAREAPIASPLIEPALPIPA
jgi:hypothetical protein